MSAPPVAAPASGHRLFAALYDAMTRREPEAMHRLRRETLAGLSGRVLEVGAGTGAMFAHYPDGVSLVAVEPDPYMLPRARRTARALGMGIEFHPLPAERLPFADGAFDAVVSALVLCSVRDQVAAVAEMWRVLRPGGELRFIEHVRGSGLQLRVQQLLAPAWRLAAGGCHLTRDTERTLRANGFEMMWLRRTSISPLDPAITGVARRPA